MGAYVKIAEYVGTGSFSFTSIPQTYKHLVIITSYGGMRVNNVSSGGFYSMTYLKGDGTSVTSGRITNANDGYLNYSGVGSGIAWQKVYLFNYTDNKYKTYLSEFSYENGTTTSAVERVVGLYRLGGAVTTLSFSNGYGLGVSTLYGIKES